MKKAAKKLVKKLKENNLTLALAESMTCGLAAHKLSGCVGVSDVLAGAIVCYTPGVKQKLLGISKTTILKHTCESKEVTEELSKKLSKLIKADIHAAITGLASEGGSETKEKPVGTVFLSVYYKRKLYHEQKLFRGTPLDIRKKASDALYGFILKCLK